ncbi:hypothetical protein [Nocardia africana]
MECPTGFTWSRELNEVSRCQVQAPVQELSTVITPLAHWISCWHGQSLQWFGPILDAGRDRSSMTIDARDPAWLMQRTRTQTTRKWQQLNVGPIAADMWREMFRLHGYDADPIVMPALASASRYDFEVIADAKYVQQDMADLAKLGLRWTVVRGRPVLGTPPTDIAAELTERDFTQGMTIHRSGAKTANDVRVVGKNGAWVERQELAGLHLQSIISLDDVFGVANIQRAAAEYVGRSAVIRDELVVPQQTTLTPDAPVELDMLVPGINFAVSALELRTILRLDQVTVTGSSSGTQIALTLSTPDNPTEIEKAGGTVQS